MVKRTLLTSIVSLSLFRGGRPCTCSSLGKSQFDTTKEFILTGVPHRARGDHPHSQWHVDVTRRRNGHVVEAGGRQPQQSEEGGIRVKDDLKTSENLQFHVAPSRDGSHIAF